MSHRDLTVVTSDTGGLANTYVYITAALAGPLANKPLKGSGATEPPALLDQQDCTFLPNALALQIGQPLRLKNSDPAFHNVHWDGKLNPPINVGFTPAPSSPERIVALNAAEFLAVRCDVHPWMTSSIAVFDHPFFTTTDANGNYTLTSLPPGTYTLTTYHPYYGHSPAQTITVSAEGTPPPANFEYSTPEAAAGNPKSQSPIPK